MNWIAHIFLSEQNTYFQIANYLADPMKGKAWENANTQVIKGMYVHKVIDSFTDKHELFIKSKKRLGKSGLLKAVVIDLTYDYLLTKNWDKFSNTPMDMFLNDFYENSINILDKIPRTAQTHLSRLIYNDILNQYQTLNDLEKAFKRIDNKLSQRLLNRDNASRYIDVVSSNIDEIERDFLEFFPHLQSEVKRHIDTKNISHWKL